MSDGFTYLFCCNGLKCFTKCSMVCEKNVQSSNLNCGLDPMLQKVNLCDVWSLKFSVWKVNTGGKVTPAALIEKFVIIVPRSAAVVCPICFALHLPNIFFMWQEIKLNNCSSTFEIMFLYYKN